MRNRVRTPSELAAQWPDLPDLELVEHVARTFPMAISPYYLSLVEEPTPSDPIFRQCVPQPEELLSPTFCVPDPLQEEEHSPVPGLVHRYPNRALSLVSSTCAMYCRHCTRKRLAGVKEETVSPETLSQQVAYLHEHPEINDVIISGGDPMTMSSARLEEALRSFRSVPSVNVIRIGTRVPVTLPMRVSDELAGMLAKYHPVWVCTHFNHPREVTAQAQAACECLLRVGIPLMNQTVLLRGVNDSADTLADLFSALIAMRVRPYYLFQCDLVRGVEHFRTPLRSGADIMQELRRKISGIACPQFIVDAPNGGGKIPAGPDYIVGSSPTETILRSSDGKHVIYPEPVDTV